MNNRTGRERAPFPADAIPRHVKEYELAYENGQYSIICDRTAGKYRLNESAAAVWSLCDGENKIGDIVELLRQCFPDDKAQITADVYSILRTLGRKRVLSFCGGTLVEKKNSPGSYHINRTAFLQQLLDRRGWSEAADDAVSDFSMWSAWKNPVRVGRLQTYDWFHTMALSDKRQLFINMERAGLGKLMPQTFRSVDEFESADDIDHNALWFLKLSSSTHGRGVFCFADKEGLKSKAAELRGASYVIQKGIDNPLLHQGRKVTIRTYVLLAGDQNIYVHPESLIRIQPEKYQRRSTDRAVQIDLYPSERTSSRMFEWYPALIPEICSLSRNTLSSVEHVFARSPDSQRYQLFGFDFGITREYEVLLLEVNDWPNMNFFGKMGDYTEVVQSLKKNVLTDLVSLLFDGERGRFI